MSEPLLTALTLAVLIAAAGVVAGLRGPVATTVAFAAYSLVLAVMWVLLRAPDVALTEAAVGAGLLTVLLFATIAGSGGTRKRGPPRPARRWPALAVLAAFGLGVGLTVPTLPAVGASTAPAQRHLGPYYLEMGPIETGIPNTVTAVLGGYRAFDTFGEIVVVFAAGVGLLAVLGADRFRLATGATPGDALGEPSPVVTTVLRLLAPFVVLVGVFVTLHGIDSAGGGFQGGVIVAAGVVLVAFAFGFDWTGRWLARGALGGLTVGGVLGFALVGLGAVLLGGAFLEHAAYPVAKPTVLGIEAIELAIAATVTGVGLAFVFGLLPGATTDADEQP